MRVALLSLFLAVVVASPATAQLSSQVVVSGLSQPVAVVQDPTQPGVQFVVQQGGRIRIVQNGALAPSDFLDLTSLVLSGGEQGLLGLAFAPDYATSRRFFVDYTRQPDGATVIARYLRSPTNPLSADPSTRFDLLFANGDGTGTNRFIVQPFANHNAGDLQFGSDGMLYIPLGDGGSGNDPLNNSQNPQQLLGKTLRLNVNVAASDTQGYTVPPDNPFVGNAAVLPPIWSFGLRNPFRTTMDTLARGGTGAFVIADVGQSAREEVDYEPMGAGGRNYGWRVREGLLPNIVTLPPFSTPLTDPILDYGRDIGQTITGGVVYRGTDLGVAFWGRYFYADFGSQHIWSVGLNVNPVTREATIGQIIDHTAELGAANISAFGHASNCQVLYVTYVTGELRRIVRTSGGAAAGCPTSPDPFLASGGGVFVNGGWVTRTDPLAAGAGLGPSAAGAGCSPLQPAPDWVCLNGAWLPPGHPLLTAGAPPPPPPPPPAGGSAGCTTPQPASTWVCVNGGWLPPNHPLAIAAAGGAGTGGATGGTGGTTPPPTGTPAACTTPQPASDWVCVNGGWLPPGHPLAIAAGTGGTTGGVTPGVTPPAGCTTPDPFATIGGGVCVAGGWVPRGHPLAGGG